MRRGVPGGGGGRGEQDPMCTAVVTHGIMRGPRLKHPRTAKSPLLPALPRTDGSRRFNKRPAFRSFRTLVPTRGALPRRAPARRPPAPWRRPVTSPRARARVARARRPGFWPSLWRNRLGGRDEFRSRSRTIGCRNEICVKLLEGVYSLLKYWRSRAESRLGGVRARAAGLEETSPKHAGVKYQWR